MNNTAFLDIKTLITIVMVISVEVVGIVQFLKNFLGKKTCNTKRYAVTSFVVCLISSILNTSWVPAMITIIYDITFLSLAVTQICYDTLVKALPQAISSFVDKILPSGNKKASES